MATKIVRHPGGDPCGQAHVRAVGPSAILAIGTGGQRRAWVRRVVSEQPSNDLGRTRDNVEFAMANGSRRG